MLISQEINDQRAEASDLCNLGTAYFGLGNYPEAVEYLEQARDISQKIKNHQIEGISLLHLADAYIGLGDYPKANESLKQAQWSLLTVLPASDPKLAIIRQKIEETETKVRQPSQNNC